MSGPRILCPQERLVTSVMHMAGGFGALLKGFVVDLRSWEPFRWQNWMLVGRYEIRGGTSYRIDYLIHDEGAVV